MVSIVILEGHIFVLAQQTRRQQQRANTAQRLYEAALELFMRQGYEVTTVEAIAQAAGVAKGTFFVHFPTKEAVLGHLGKQQIERLQHAIATDTQFAERDIRTQLRFIYRTIAAGVDQQPELAKKLTVTLLRSERAFDSELLSFDMLDKLLVPLVVQAQERGELRRDASAEELTLLIRGAYFIALSGWFQQPNMPFAPQAERMLDLVLDGLT